MEEIWKDVSEYEGLYQVSNYGRVKSLGNGNSNASKERILKPFANKDGYLHVCFYKDGNRKHYSVHRLVLTTFNPVENMENLDIDHINTTRSDNRLENLNWCNHKENCNNPLSKINYSEAQKGKIGVKCHNSISIVKLTRDGELVEVYGSTYEAERSRFNNGHITECIKGKRKTHHGYRWEYLHIYLLQKYPRIVKLNLFGKHYDRKGGEN